MLRYILICELLFVNCIGSVSISLKSEAERPNDNPVSTIFNVPTYLLLSETLFEGQIRSHIKDKEEDTIKKKTWFFEI